MTVRLHPKKSEPSTASIPLERPASVRRYLPLPTDGWLLPYYVVGPENKLLLHVFSPDTIGSLHDQSPVVFYGETNVGKTALSITLATMWTRLTKLRPVCFTTGKNFATNYAEAVDVDDIRSFRKKHRTCKMLVIDDLDSIGNKSAAQIELLHTLDALAEKKRPVLVSATRLPATLKSFSPALSSRLSQGLSIPLVKPSPSSSAELIRSLVEQIDPNLPIEPLCSLVASFQKSSISLDATQIATVVTLAHQSLVAHGAFDRSIVARLAKSHFLAKSPTVDGIAKATARRMKVKLTDLRGSTRRAHVVRARGLAILLSRQLTKSSLQQIGKYFRGRDHSTILHACRKTTQLLDSDGELALFLLEIQSELAGD